jgi:serine/threonine protein kinase
MAPEQLASPEKIDRRADLYALGVTFYELLTGTRPVGTWRPASLINPTVPLWFDAILARLMAPITRDRFDDAEELLAAIHAERPKPSAAVTLRFRPNDFTSEIPNAQIAARTVSEPDRVDRRAVASNRDGPRDRISGLLVGAKVGACSGAIWGIRLLVLCMWIFYILFSIFCQ